MGETHKTPSLASKAIFGMGAGLAALTPFEVLGQDAKDVVALDAIVLEGGAGYQGNTNTKATNGSRLPGAVKDIPQIVNVVPREVLEEQNVATLEQALRNVPGITVAIGEANGGPNGDRFRIRGFEAMGDAYRDGLRDFGVYTRDSFNYENVQVLKGPSSQSFGAGTTGGVINSGSKSAQLDDFVTVDASVGNGLARSTLDYNKQINETTALRITGMVNDQDIADRNGVKSDRWGVAASVGFGLGTNTSWQLDYFHQSNKRTPDYGVPMAAATADGKGVRVPITSLGVPRANYYGKDTDIDDSDADIITSRFSHGIDGWLTINNDTRIARYNRFLSVTPTICGSNDAGCDAVGRALFSGVGNPLLAYGGGSGPSYDQTSQGIQNVTTAIAKFDVGGLRNEAVFGLDISYQQDERQTYRYDGSKERQSVWFPNSSSASYKLVESTGNTKKSRSTNVGLFASDRLWLNEQWSVLGGLRWDYYDAVYNTQSRNLTTGVDSSTRTTADTSFVSPKASVIWEPNKDQSYYLSYAVAMNVPFGQSIATDTNAITSARTEWQPEKSQSFELGTKQNLLDGKLGVTGALFQITKGNAYNLNAANELVASGDKQRIRGVELGLSGKLTDQWSMNASYTYLDSEVLFSNTKETIGQYVPGVARHSASLWSSYTMAPNFGGRDDKLTLGGGVTYRDAMYIRSSQTAKLPESVSVDAMISYEVEDWQFSLNGYNLTDRVNYDSFFQGENANTARATPSSGRTAVLRVAKTF